MTEQLDEMTLYHRLQQIYVLLDDGDRRALRNMELTPTQYNLLQRLGTNVETGLTITELADKLLCTRGNATRLVQRLDQQGLVRVGGDPADQRLVRVALTPLGAQRLAAARTAHTASIQRRMGDLEPAAQKKFMELTESLVALLSADLATQN